VALSAREISVFELLFQHHGRVVSKEQILERLYGYDETPSLNAIEVYISRLRKKLEPSGAVVRTCHGRGYQLEAELRAASAGEENR
jgi:two-component system, OmpR family, response regulator